MPLLPSVTPNINDLKIGEYKVIVVDAESGTSQDLSQLVSSIQWDYDLDQPAEHYQISFVHTMNIANRVKPGDRIKIYGWAVRPAGASNLEIYWELLKRIYIASTSMSSEQGGTLKATGYNVFWFMMRNKDTVMLNSETATQFIIRTASYYSIPLYGVDRNHPQGQLLDTGVVLEREAFMNRTIWDMWVTTLSYTRDINPDARFLLQEIDGTVALVNRTPPAAIWEFSRGYFEPGPESWNNNPGNIFSSENTFSMENYSNVIRVYKGGSSASEGFALLEGNPLASSTEAEPVLQFQYPAKEVIEAGGDLEINRYGMFVESIDLQSPGETALDLGNNAANAEQQGMKLYKKLVKFDNTGTITSFNVNTMRPGDPVHIRDEITGLVGKYYIKSGSHIVSDSEASMSLTVNIEDALPEAYAARPQKQDTGGLLGDGASTVGPSGREWTKMSGSVSIMDRYQLAVAAGFKPGDEAITMVTISLYECGNCDMTVPSPSRDLGIWQINEMHWPNYGGQELLSNPPANARAAFGIFSAAGGAPSGYRQWHVYPNWNGVGTGQPQSVFDAKMEEVRAVVGSGGTSSKTSWVPTDMRGKLPTNWEAEYGTRSLAGITGVTLHYTAGSSTQSAYEVAQYQTSEAARGQTGNNTPFPGLAYTLFVELNGKTSLAWDLNVACWHASAGNRNQINVGICYAGDVAPSEAQKTAMAQAIGWLQLQLGKKLGIEGHKDIPYATQCPGDAWPAWKQDIISRIPLNL